MRNDAIPFRFFEPKEEYYVIERGNLPHWTQAGTICFITWRTWDSIPKRIADEWLRDRCAWLSRHGVDPYRRDWKTSLVQLSPEEQVEFHNIFSERWLSLMDNCYGECVLRQGELAKIVGESLHHFDGDRYILFDFVVMPNHVHLLAAFPSEDLQLKQCQSWKHYTAVQINRVLERKNRFWEVDDFDHLVRSEEQFEYLRRYIEENPRKARLPAGEFLHYSRLL